MIFFNITGEQEQLEAIIMEFCKICNILSEK